MDDVLAMDDVFAIDDVLAKDDMLALKLQMWRCENRVVVYMASDGNCE